MLNNMGNSTYNSLQVSLLKTTSRGLFIGASYTFARGLDDGTSTGSTGQTISNYRLEKGLSADHVQNRLIFDVVYELPFGRGKPYLSNAGKLDKLVGGWCVSTITLFQSGSPLTIALTI